MPLYRCNACGYVAEESITPVGKSMPCNRCAKPVTVFGTVFYVEKLLERYTSIRHELQALRALEAPPAATPPSQPETVAAPADMPTDANLATVAQHAPLQAWFQARQIQVAFEIESVNTAGYFDEAARAFGEGYALFGELISRVCWSYRKAHSSLNLELARLSQKDATSH